MELAQRYRLARALTLVEDRGEGWHELLAEAYRAPRRAVTVGFAGAPGVGKSTLVDRLASFWAAAADSVAVLAVDPTSPFTAGALLGDRIRMQRSADEAQVFIRSVAARGHSGGLAAAIADLCAVLDHHGVQRILIETIGTGQADTEVVDHADCVVSVTAPGMGDGVQAAKAGWMEIGDLYVVNKRDLAGAEEALQILKLHLASLYPGRPGANAMQHDGHPVFETPGRAWREGRHGKAERERFWHPRVLAVSAHEGQGVEEVAAAIEAFLAWRREGGREEAMRAVRLEHQMAGLLAERVLSWARARTANGAGLSDAARDVLAGRITPHAAVETLLMRLGVDAQPVTSAQPTTEKHR